MAAAPAGSMQGSPLSQADLKLLNQALYKLSEAVQAMDKAEAAGIDVSDQRLMQQDLLTQLVAIKQTYFPGAP
jgi:hypothetical protein